MAIIWDSETQETKRCFKVYRFGEYIGTHILTAAQVTDFGRLPGYQVRPSYWVSETR